MKYISIKRVKAKALLFFTNYIRSGATNEDFIDLWLEEASTDFGMTSLPIKEVALKVNKSVVELPCDFESVVNAYTCGTQYSPVIDNPTSHFYLEDCRVTRIDEKCNECTYQNECDNCCTIPKRYQAVNKVTGKTVIEYNTESIMTPHTRGVDSDKYTYKIEGNKMHTKLREGVVHLIYKSNVYDEDGDLIVIDNRYVHQYLIDYVKYKIMEAVMYNDSDGGNYRINQNNYQLSEMNMLISKTKAETDLKSWGKRKTGEAINRRRRRHNNYRGIVGRN